MVQCEMCGASTSSPKTVKIEGAELDVCGTCSDFGTEVDTGQSSSTSTKYSTGSSGGSSTASSGSSTSSTSPGSGGRSSGSSSGGRSDMFDDVDELAQDYDDRIREARETKDLTQADLADELNEKASLINKLERGDTLPSDDLQSKLERYLDISLSGSASPEDTEWEGSSADGEYTLGDVVKRKD